MKDGVKERQRHEERNHERRKKVGRNVSKTDETRQKYGKHGKGEREKERDARIKKKGTTNERENRRNNVKKG